jgi:hypothetical protein
VPAGVGLLCPEPLQGCTLRTGSCLFLDFSSLAVLSYEHQGELSARFRFLGYFCLVSQTPGLDELTDDD